MRRAHAATVPTADTTAGTTHSPAPPQDESSAEHRKKGLVGSASSAATVLAAAEYTELLRHLRAAWVDMPPIHLAFEQLGFHPQVPEAATGKPQVPTVATALADTIRRFNVCKKTATHTFKALDGISGTLRGGELALIMAPPGHGKSLFLKALAGRLSVHDSATLRGTVRWNGLTQQEAHQQGLQIHRLTAYVDQVDVHMSVLTVRETFEFAMRNSNADIALLHPSESSTTKATPLSTLQARKVDLMLDLLGLRECADTVVGDAALRGISGGQRKRVSIGEMLLSNARALLLDEISTGLDSLTTYDIVNAVKQWCAITGGVAAIALLQPTPQTFALFDRLMLLREGQLIFNGSAQQLQTYLVDALQVQPDGVQDFADWIVEFLTDPKTAEDKQRGQSQQQQHEHSDVQVVQPMSAPFAAVCPAVVTMAERSVSRVRFHLDAEEDGAAAALSPKALGVVQLAVRSPHSAAQPSLDIASLRRAFEESGLHLQQMAEVRAALSLAATHSTQEISAFTRASFYTSTSHHLWHHLWLNTQRQYLLLRRSPSFWLPRFITAIWLSLLMGSLWYKVDTSIDGVVTRMGLINAAVINLCFGNISQIPLDAQHKLVVHKQRAAGFFSPMSYVGAAVAAHFPIAAIESFFFGIGFYFMSDFVVDGGRCLFFLLSLFCADFVTSSFFRLFAYIFSLQMALNAAMPTIGFLFVFGGIMITPDHIPNWLIEFYYLLPVGWITRSVALNEYHSDRYTREDGDRQLGVYEFSTNEGYKWGGIGYVLGLVILINGLAVLAIKHARPMLSTGAKRVDSSPQTEGTDETAIRVQIVPPGSKPAATPSEQLPGSTASGALASLGGLSFQPLHLTFSDLSYTVQVTETDTATGQKRTVDRLLLQNLSGVLPAGSITALMGSSGAGKTTLLDVLAGRKNTGVVRGSINVNGTPQHLPTFGRQMAFAEQDDCHLSTATVREAVALSAALRLPASVTSAEREAFVESILVDLELDSIADRQVGTAGVEGSLAPGELKRVTLGVELAANPPLLLVDEPTSGLDSRSALIVMRVLHKVSRRGRNVVVTIHAPSAELFNKFDRLMLLHKGEMVYQGPIFLEDRTSSAIVDYFQSLQIDGEFERLPAVDLADEDFNSASWMLEVIGAGTRTRKLAPFSKLYQQSKRKKINEEHMQQLDAEKIHSSAHQQPASSLQPAIRPSFFRQLWLVTARLFKHYNRDVGNSYSKLIVQTIYAIVTGLLWLQIGDSNEAGIISKISSVLQGVGMLGLFHAGAAMPAMFALRSLFYREQSSHTYSPLVFSTALFLVELVYLFGYALLFTLPYYFLVGYENDGSLFFRFVLSVWFCVQWFVFVTQLLALLLPNMPLASFIASCLFYTPTWLFGGVYIPVTAIPVWWKWIYQMNGFSKTILTILVGQYACEGEGAAAAAAAAASCPTVHTETEGLVLKRDYVNKFFASSAEWEATYYGWLVLTMAVLQFLIAIVVLKVRHDKR